MHYVSWWEINKQSFFSIWILSRTPSPLGDTCLTTGLVTAALAPTPYPSSTLTLKGQSQEKSYGISKSRRWSRQKTWRTLKIRLIKGVFWPVCSPADLLTFIKWNCVIPSHNSKVPRQIKSCLPIFEVFPRFFAHQFGSGKIAVLKN